MTRTPPRAIVHLTRRYWFSASHRLHNPALDDSTNEAIYGKCNNPGGHGHNYFVEVTAAGPINPRTGMVLDLAELDRFVEKNIVSRFDEGNLNDDAEFAHAVPTTENLCRAIHHLMQVGWRTMP